MGKTGRPATAGRPEAQAVGGEIQQNHCPTFAEISDPAWRSYYSKIGDKVQNPGEFQRV